MSHRDQDCRSEVHSYAQELSAAIGGLFAHVDWTGVRFRKDCGWAVPGLAVAALLWAWSGRTNLTDRFTQALKVARGLGRWRTPGKTSYQAFLKLLVRWTAPLRSSLSSAFQRLMEKRFPELFRIAGYVVLAADGSKLQLARTRSNEDRFSPVGRRQRRGRKRRRAEPARRRPRTRRARQRQARDKKADSPQMALTLLYHVRLRLPWDWRLGPSASSERQHLTEMIPQLPADALVTADCGFVGYEFWSGLFARGCPFVIRVGGNVRLLRRLGVVRENNGIVYLWPDREAKRRRPPLVLRLVEVHDGRRPWALVTSVLDRRRLSDRQVVEIYRRRWRIELFFRHFKQTYGRAKLRSHKAEHAECEANWSLLGLWAVLLHAAVQSPEGIDRRSVARVLRAFAEVLDEPEHRPEAGETLADRLARALSDRYRRKHKTSRNYPRKKYEAPAGKPRIATATPDQRRRARELRRLSKQM
jgi:Transposase DDE domain